MITIVITIEAQENGDVLLRDDSPREQHCTRREMEYAQHLSKAWKAAVPAIAAKFGATGITSCRRD